MSKNPASYPPENAFRTSAAAYTGFEEPVKLVKARQNPIAEPVLTRRSMQDDLPSELKRRPTLPDREPAAEFGVFSRQPLDILQLSSLLAAYLIFR